MTDAIEKLIRDQVTELLAQNVSSISEELRTSAEAKLTVNMGFKLQLAANRIYIASGVAFSRKYADSSEGMVELPDPNQPGLPLEEPSVTIRTDDMEATLTGKQFAEVARRAGRKAKEEKV
jgi:hypothetical protein